MQNVNVTSTAAEIIATAQRAGTLVLQNQSDTTLLLAFGSNGTELTSSLGIKLEPGETMIVDRPTSWRAVWAIHGGSGDKALHWQLV